MNSDVLGARYDGLLAAVIAEPEASEHRLVLADWLQEQGEPLGEFIQLVVQADDLERALARAPQGAVEDDPANDGTATRIFELREAAERIRRRHRRRWLEPQLTALAPPDRYRGPALHIDFAGGLPERLSCTPEQLGRAVASVARLPLRELTLRCLAPSDMDPAPDPHLAVLAGEPLLARIDGLRIEGCDQTGSLYRRRAEALTVVGSLRGARLRRLALVGGGGAWPEAVHTVAELEPLEALTLEFPLEGSDLAPLVGRADLRELRLGSFDDDVARSLADLAAPLERVELPIVRSSVAIATLIEARWLSTLRELELVGRPPARELFDWSRWAARAPGLPTLERLSVAYLRVTAESSPAPELLQRLGSLGLSNCALDGATLTRILGGGAAPRLRDLDLSGNRLAHGLEALGKATLPALEDLKLAGAGLRPGDVKLLTSARLPTLTGLALDENAIGDAGLVALARGRWPGLRRLSLRYTQAGPLGLRALLDSELVGQLSSLTLSGNKLGISAAALLGAADFGHLRTLRVNACQLGAGGYEALLQNPTLGELRELWIDGSEVDAVCRALGASPTITKLERLWAFTSNDMHAQTIEARSLEPLLHAPCAEHLSELRLLFQPLSPAAADLLIASTGWAELERLDLDPRALSLEQRAGLRERFGLLTYWGD